MLFQLLKKNRKVLRMTRHCPSYKNPPDFEQILEAGIIDPLK